MSSPPLRATSVRTRVAVAFGVAVVAAAVAGLLGAGVSSPLIGWDAGAVLFCAWVWVAVWPMSADSTAAHAQRDDPSRDLTDLILVGAAVASLVAVGIVLADAGQASGADRYVRAGFALASVFVSWTLVHTVFTLRYARLYYSDPVGGIDFNQPEPPAYTDFAYLAFTIGMTFQVSDTNIRTSAIRRAALRHGLVSFPMGTVIIAGAINLVSGLAK